MIGTWGNLDLSSKLSEATLNQPDLETSSNLISTVLLPANSASGPTPLGFLSFLASLPSPSPFSPSPPPFSPSADSSVSAGPSPSSPSFLNLNLLFLLFLFLC